MRLLLDTHTYLWAIQGGSSLSSMVIDLVEDPDNSLIISIASIWEIAIKLSLKKLELDFPFTEVASKIPESHGLTVLPITPEHLGTVADLDFHHRDPFDRLLVALCMIEHLPLVSRDRAFDGYEIERLW